MKKQSFNKVKNVECPNCKKTDRIGNVISSRGQSGAVVNRKYCRNCLLEFDLKGIMYPPLY